VPEPRPFSPRQERLANPIIRAFSAANVWIFRLSRGRLGARFPGGAPVLLLTTRGRRSGRRRTVPLIYMPDGKRVVLVASKGGMSKHPVWYLNLEADPNVEVEIGSERLEMLARRANRAEKAALWPRLLEVYRDYDDYQARTERDIPVVILSPR
jgi:deazaflavin-dependent oxidoreductase (nitroreductase family)